MAVFSVHGAPSEYILKENALDLLESKLLERNLRNVLVVHGNKSWEAAKVHWPVLTQVQFHEYTYGGECSVAEIDAIARLVEEQLFDAVIGVGGGKVLDLVKAVCDQTKRQAILIPTLASNCSPWTPLSVIYDESGAFVRYDIYPICTSLVLVEPQILVEAPIEMLIAGIGDTLAKWYEADVQMAVLENKSVPLQISHYAARQCKELLLQHSHGALEAAKSVELNDDFIKVTEAIFMLGGMVGGYGDHYGRIAGAHAIHNGLTILEETHHALHGDKVAYGILIQLVLEDKWAEIEILRPFYEKLGLPLSLRDLGAAKVTDSIAAAVAEKATVAQESIHVMPIGNITAERVKVAILALEARQKFQRLKNLLENHEFQLMKIRKHASEFEHKYSGEVIYLIPNKIISIVLCPATVEHSPDLSERGERYRNSALSRFPKELGNGKDLIHYGYIFKFAKEKELEAFLEAL